MTLTDDPARGAPDRVVLEAFYHETGGPNWLRNSNWLSDEPLTSWAGVRTNGNGHVTELNLHANRLTGSIPPELGRLVNLEWLNLDSNQLSGRIPPELGRLTNLRLLGLGSNQLSGPIPPELGHLTALRSLQLGHNQLSGRIPPELGRLAGLEWLSLGANQLNGSIPPELGRLANLKWLYLHENHLIGSIPPELGNLAKLEHLHLRTNDVSGPFPLPLRSPLRGVDLFYTRVCLPPADGAFEAWVTSAEYFRQSGITCGEVPSPISAIDVAVFYTPAARRRAGGIAAIEALIDLMIAETNQVYRESGVNQRLLLVAREEVQYTETTDPFLDLYRFAAPSDNHMDEVHTIRDRNGADLVHLISPVNDWGVGGIAYLGGDFGVTDYRGGTSTFAHETGHNGGLNHDRFTAFSPRHENGVRQWPYPYSYGYVNQRAFSAGTAASRRWRTIMSYVSQCVGENISCSDILRFSNPRQTYNGDPLGEPGVGSSLRADGPSDAARTLNNTRHSMAAFRSPAVNRPPLPEGTLPNRTLDAGATVVDVAGAFWDPDGDTLTHGASSSAPTVATVDVAGSAVTVTPVAAGAATITVTATDTGGSNTSAALQFAVVVENPPGGLTWEQLRRYRETWRVLTATFTEHRITPGSTPIRVVHLLELRGRVDALRMRFGLAAFPWTDPVPTAGVTPVKRVHLTELRAALDAVYDAAGQRRPRYTDATVTAGMTGVKAVHLTELQAAVMAVHADTAAGRRTAPPSEGVDTGQILDTERMLEVDGQSGDIFAMVDSQDEALAPVQRDRDTVTRDFTLRRRPVKVDVEKLARAAGGTSPRAVTLNLFDDVVFTGIIERRSPTFSGGYALSGRLEGVELGTMTLLVNDSAVAGAVRTPFATYRIGPAGESMHAVSQIDPSRLPKGAEPLRTEWPEHDWPGSRGEH